MHKNLSTFDRIIRLLLAVFALFVAAVIFVHPVARIVAAAFALFSLWEAAVGKCPLMARLGQSAPGAISVDGHYLLGLSAIQAVIAYEWWSAGLGKVASPAFVEGIDGMLAVFASRNPFPWYKAFLEGFATENSTMFAYAVEWGQVAIAAALVASIVALLWMGDELLARRASLLAVLALAGGMLMNANFYLAAGWTSPGTRGLNAVMFLVQAILAYVWLSRMIARRSAHRA